MTAAGAVLCGGRSTRMGRDKALVLVEGEAMAARVAAALCAGGCDRVFAVGGDLAALASIGLTAVLDDHPGEGPLGGILTALRVSGSPVAVFGCDMPWLTGAVVATLIESLGDHAVAVARGDRVEPLGAVWSPASAPALADAFAGGERAVHRVLAGLDVIEVPVERAVVRSVNSPSDLPRHDGRR